MSITIKYQPTAKERNFEGGTSTTFGVLKDIFGTHIRSEDLSKLRAIAIATNNKFYDEVADVVQREGEIRFWDTY